MDECSCDKPGFCERRGCIIPKNHWVRCKQGRVDVIDRLYATAAENQGDFELIDTTIPDHVRIRPVFVNPKPSRASSKRPPQASSKRPPRHQVIERTPFSKTDQVLQFVWFYVPGPENGMELKLSMASVARNFTGVPKFTVIGDCPSWYTGHFIPLPRKNIREVESFDVLPFRDTQNKLVHAVDHPEIDEKFCWIMDDVYMLQPTSAEDLEVPRIDPWYRSGTREWHRRIGDTFAALKQRGHSTHQYATHLPHIFEKQKLHQMFDEFDYPKTLLLFENLYGNRFRSDPVPYTGFLRRLLRLSAGPIANRVALLDGIEENILNYQATVWGRVMSDWLQERFLKEQTHETV